MSAQRNHTPALLPAPLIGWCLLGLVLTVATGCSREKHVIEIDNRFSVNVIRVPDWYPDEKTVLTPAQNEVMFRRGQPDFFRFWWRPDGSFITSADMASRQEAQIAQQVGRMEKSWVYLKSDEEIIFRADGGSYESRPVSSLLKIICQYGDPSERSLPKVVDGHHREIWRWIEYGMEIKIIDGEPSEPTFPFKGTGQGTWGLK